MLRKSSIISYLLTVLWSKHFNSGHQIFGLIIIIAMIAQAIIGFMHHRIYLATLAPTKLAPVHVYLGRILIGAGVSNGFL